MLTEEQKKVLKEAEEIQLELERQAKEEIRKRRLERRKEQQRQKKEREKEAKSKREETENIIKSVIRRKYDNFDSSFQCLNEKLDEQHILQNDLEHQIKDLKRKLEDSKNVVRQEIKKFKEHCIHPYKYVKSIRKSYYEETGGGQGTKLVYEDIDFCLLCGQTRKEKYENEIAECFVEKGEWTFQEDQKEKIDWLLKLSNE